MEQPGTDSDADVPASTTQGDADKQEMVETLEQENNTHSTDDTPSTDDIPTTDAETVNPDKQDTPTETSAVEEEPEIAVDPAVVEKLTMGLLGLFLPNLQRAKGSLNEVLHNQEVLIETVTQENAKFTESAAMKDLTDTMKETRIYNAKLLNLKKEMNGLMDKSTKLKKRAVKLQQQKHKEVLDRAVQRDRELDREKMLTAKIARPGDKKDKEPSS